MSWYYHLDGIERGPIDGTELYALVSSGQLKPETPIRKDGELKHRPFASYFPSRAELPAIALAVTPTHTLAALDSMVRCWQCNQHYVADDLILLAGRNICGACKPAFAQRLREGVLPGHRDLVLASFDRRATAKIIDFVLLLIVTTSLLRSRTLQILVLLPFHGSARAIVWISFSLAFALTVTSLYTFLLHGYSGQTLGKLLAEIRVVRPNGLQLSFPQSAGRSAAEVLSRILLLGYLIAAADPELRTFHDRVAGTRVIRV